jgi:molybdenum cofactor cytidylyltransferase
LLFASMKLGVIILAAGASVRMGRPKLLLPWGKSTVLAHLLAQWREIAPAQLALVLNAAAPGLDAELARLSWPAEQKIPNPDPGRGMFSSVLCAATWPGWKHELTHWAIALGDQPLVRTGTLRRLLHFAEEHAGAVSQPSRGGRGRHPVILPKPAFSQLKGSTATNLKEFIVSGGWPVARCEMDDTGLDLDLDEPADYERALVQAAETQA